MPKPGHGKFPIKFEHLQLPEHWRVSEEQSSRDFESGGEFLPKGSRRRFTLSVKSGQNLFRFRVNSLGEPIAQTIRCTNIGEKGISRRVELTSRERAKFADLFGEQIAIHPSFEKRLADEHLQRYPLDKAVVWLPRNWPLTESGKFFTRLVFRNEPVFVYFKFTEEGQIDLLNLEYGIIQKTGGKDVGWVDDKKVKNSLAQMLSARILVERQTA